MPFVSTINEDEKIIKDLCDKLNILVKSILHAEPCFIYTGSKEKGYYSIYNDNTQGKNTDLSLNFRLHYPDKKSFSYHKEAKYLKDKEFNKYIKYKYEDSKLLYVKIEWFSVSPTGKCIGSKVIDHFIDLLKNIDSLELILLTPKNHNSRNFWIENKFIDEDFSIEFDKRIDNSACKRLVYKF